MNIETSNKDTYKKQNEKPHAALLAALKKENPLKAADYFQATSCVKMRANQSESRKNLAVASTCILPVLLPLALEEPYAYTWPGEPLDIGSLVQVPLGNRKYTGVIWDKPIAPSNLGFPAHKLRKIISGTNIRKLRHEEMQFLRWVADYTISPVGMILRLMLSVPSVFDARQTETRFRLTGEELSKTTPKRQQVIEALDHDGDLTAAQLKEKYETGSSILKALSDLGVIEKYEFELEYEMKEWPEILPGKPLSGEQKQAVKQLASFTNDVGFNVTLVDGVTGSGKTEVYFEIVENCLRRQQQALILLPEIALTGQFLNRFEKRFGFKAASWHSSMTPAQRRTVWRAISTGETPVVIGARSALFLPFPNLGLIVVDEEHEPAYKQEDNVRYQGRDMAVLKARLEDIPILLCSATPSLESWVNTQEEKYNKVELKSRYHGSQLPVLATIDLRVHPCAKGDWISPVLLKEIEKCMQENRQTLLFLNRRGYAPLTLCRKCGFRFECPDCSTWLVEHRFRHNLTCHHCGYETPMPTECPDCQSVDSMVACGPGVERIGEEVSRHFPQARMAMLSSDLLPTPGKQRAVLQQIEAGHIDIIVGTQLIAKGHHFPKLKLVGVVDGDLGLAQSDPRAAERTLQLIHQVSGRAGRTKEQGYAFIQTHMPEHPLMQAIVSGKRENFYQNEIQVRQQGGLPPFGRLVAIIVLSEDLLQAQKTATLLRRLAPQSDRIVLLGPAEAPLFQLRKKYRYRLLLKTDLRLDVQSYVKKWLANIQDVPTTVQINVDVDPYNFL